MLSLSTPDRLIAHARDCHSGCVCAHLSVSVQTGVGTGCKMRREPGDILTGVVISIVMRSFSLYGRSPPSSIESTLACTTAC